MVAILSLHTFVLFVEAALAIQIIYDGRVPLDYTQVDLDNSVDPYLTVVKGSENASHYTTLLGSSTLPTPLWNRQYHSQFNERVIAVTIDNSSVFVPGGSIPQYGFRRTDIIAQKAENSSSLVSAMETGVSVFHFSIKTDESRPLNYSHEYQVVFIEPNDGSHVFDIQLGSPFTNPTGTLPALNAHNFKVRDHARNVLFSTPFTYGSWHNFGVQVDWNNRTLAVLYSQDATPLQPVTKVIPNLTTTLGSIGQGDFHFGILKLPLVNPLDSPNNQGDVVHFGVQEGTTEGLLYSGIFVESIQDGISVGGGHTIRCIGS
ncbi:hypothetical protein BYT27DRAFT_7075551 [Phlegmacium glaucopus]|nr:hypothetical protein BYT27DRAFT_7075551 [Phlegmacium glaucopus]